MFCGRCGSQIEANSRFCANCGTPADAPAVPVAPPPAAYVPPAAAAAAPVKKKGLSPLVWVLIVVLGLFFVFAAAIGVGGFVIFNKVKQAGFEASDKGFSFKDDKGQKVTVEAKGEGDQGGIVVKTAEGTAQFGGTVKLPGWLPAYPGSTPAGLAGQDSNGYAGAFTFSTGDASDKIITFYEQELKKGGFEVNEVNQHPGGAMLSASNGMKKVTINALTTGGGCTVTVTFEDK